MGAFTAESAEIAEKIMKSDPVSAVQRAGPVAAALLLGVLAGCALLGRARFEAPGVSLAQVRVTGIGLTGGTLDLVFDVYNPNSYELRTTRMDVRVALEGIHFGEVALGRVVTLPRESDSEVTVPLRFTWEGVGAGARALIARGSVQYRLEGRMLVGTPVGDRAVSLAREDVATLRDLTR
jgi:LEA14-like dessication related protein